MPKRYGDDSTANRRLASWRKGNVWKKIITSLIETAARKNDQEMLEKAVPGKLPKLPLNRMITHGKKKSGSGKGNAKSGKSKGGSGRKKGA